MVLVDVRLLPGFLAQWRTRPANPLSRDVPESPEAQNTRTTGTQPTDSKRDQKSQSRFLLVRHASRILPECRIGKDRPTLAWESWLKRRPDAPVSEPPGISKRHLARQFPGFFRDPLGFGFEFPDIQFQFLPLRGGDPVDHRFVLLHFPEDFPSALARSSPSESIISRIRACKCS
jgi:hypothetical protein